MAAAAPGVAAVAPAVAWASRPAVVLVLRPVACHHLVAAWARRAPDCPLVAAWAPRAPDCPLVAVWARRARSGVALASAPAPRWPCVKFFT